MAAKTVNIRRPGETGRYTFSLTAGFSILELVIVLAVICVLLTLAVPSYQSYVQRANRTEAIRMMLAIADCQERHRADTGFYDTTRCSEGAGTDSHELRMEPPDSAASLEFTIVAQPRPGRQDHCGNLSLDQAGTRGISGSQDDLGKCWSGR